MLMELTVISEQQSQLKDRCSIQLEGDLLSIGRGVDNHWVLPDDNLHLSGKHCIVGRKNDDFIITDLSTNGVFLDSQETPLGRGRSAVLKNGSLIRIGDYRISVSINQLPHEYSNSSPFHSGELTGSGLATALSDTSLATSGTPSASRIKTSDDHLSPERVNLMVSRPKPLPEHQPVLPDDWLQLMGASEAESEELIEPPSSESTDGVDISVLDAVAEEATVVPASINSKPNVVDTPLITECPSVADSEVLSDSAILNRILSAAGLDPSLVKDAPMLADRLGLLLKTFANGMIQALTTRSLVKGEFRLQQTMIQPTDNNPFKFSPTGREALNIILFSEGQAYQSGNKAIEESFADIQAHQLAMMSGVQDALFKLLSRLDPESLEQQFQRKPRHFTGMPGLKKVSYWDEYKDFYEALKESMSDDLQGFFIKEFGMAYEDQLKKLKHEV